MLPINFDINLAKKLDQGMRSGEAVELPFPVIYLWALNGQPSYKSQGGALYYGGWASKVEDVQMATDQQGLSIPADWKQVTIASRNGGEFAAFTTRELIVAPIGKRLSWLHDGKRSAEYVEGGRRHLQVLVYLGEKRENQIVPWAPAVLTGKGYQARNLLDAFARWDKFTAQIRWRVAPGVPAWCFWLKLGTFGPERESVNVGKPGAQSPITPLTCFVPEKALTEQQIGHLYVGNDVVSIMSDLQDRAQEWLTAWQPQALAAAEAEFVYGTEEPSLEEEIPF